MSGEEILDKARALEKNLLNFFWRQGVQYGECEDLLQETYIRLWKYRDEYVPTAKFSTFAFMIAHQVRVDALRRKVCGKQAPSHEGFTRKKRRLRHLEQKGFVFCTAFGRRLV